MAIDKKGVSPTDYTLINIKDIGRNRSVFGALSFEDVKKSLQAGVYLSRTKSMDNVSPVDDLIDLA
jgi:hypothetical protein